MLHWFLRDVLARLGTERHRLAVRFGFDHHPIDPARIRRAIGPESRILFVCANNVCRSPLAEHAFRATAEGNGHWVDSAGFIDRTGRKSSELAVTTAAEYGIDLSPHRSAMVTRQHVTESDLVFVMDARSYYAFSRRFGDSLGKVYYLKPLLERANSEPNAYEIEDPDGKDEETFRRVFSEVTDAVTELTRAIDTPNTVLQSVIE